MTQAPVQRPGAAPRWITLVGARHEVVFLLLSVALTNGSAYLFHVVMARLLGPAAYGGLGAILSIVLIIGVPASALQVTVARRIATCSPDVRGSLVRAVARDAARAGLVVGAIVLACAPLLSAFLHLRIGVVLPLVAIGLTGFVAPVLRGGLQGSRRFWALGSSLLATAGARLLVGPLLVVWGFGLPGAVASTVLAELAAVGVAWIVLRPTLGSTPLDRPRGLLQEAAEASASLFGFWVLTGLDLILVRHALPPAEAGAYAVAALPGRAVLFLGAGLVMTVFPKLAEDPHSEHARRLLQGAAALIIAMGLAVAGVMAIAPQLLRTVAGGGPLPPRSLAPLIALSMTAFGVVGLLVNYRLAAHRPIRTGLGVAALCEVAVVVVAGEGTVAIAALTLGVAAMTAATLWGPAARAPRMLARSQGELWDAPASALELSVITPAFNGEDDVPGCLQDITSALRDAGVSHEVILVSDGSTDGTVDAARAFESRGVRVLHYEANEGKGHALRTGMARATGRFVAFIDSDGDLDPADLVRFLALMRLYEADVVVGSKRHPLSQVSYPPLRQVMSWAYHKLVRLLFGLRVRDTQTGVKLIRREALAEVLPRLLEKRFAFDLELLVALRRARYRRTLEAPVTLRYRFSSSVSWRSVLGIIRDTAAIWHRCYLLGHYDPAATQDPWGLVPSPVAVEAVAEG